MSWRYSRWDGSQRLRDLDADEVLGKIADDLLYHGDVEAALRRLLQEGWTTEDGRRVEGLRELMERIRARRQELTARDPSGLTEDVVRALDEVLSAERRGIDQQAERARREAGGDEVAAQRAGEHAAEQHTELDLLPDGLADQIRALRAHEFASPQAEQRFEELLDQLRHDLAQMQLDRAAAAMAQAGPEEREHLRAGLAALNQMLAQRAAGQEIDPSFEEFAQQFGDLFPGANTLDELLEQLAQRMAAASSFLASLDDDQRAQLEALSAELLGDLDLAWQMDQLSENLQQLMPQLGWDQRAGGQGPAIGLGEVGELFSELGALSRLEQQLSSATGSAALAEVPREAAEVLGPDAAASLEALAQLTKRLEAAGLVARREGRLKMTPRGLRRLGTKALEELFARLRRDRLGDHPLAMAGVGHDPEGETKPYEFGDPFRLDVQETVRNAVRRSAVPRTTSGRPGVELPVSLHPDDFAVERSEQVAAAATVLAVDLSLSMPMRDNFLAAKKVAMALQALIASRYPRDYLGLIGFSATAREIRAEELPEVSWDFAYGTNLQHTLALARRMLAHRSGAKQVILITDGEPTAHVLEDGEVFFNYPPVPETIEATLHEVARCTRERIRINTFALDSTGELRAFVEEMTRRNRGRAFFATPDTLGDYVLVDFVEQRSARSRLTRGA
ncbi:MAG: hypothetical protein JWM85_3589 [Acidimicrobiaceae bacterium]|nr:hypothetical protein [Acidimicrobiaceae bacterium]